MKGILLAYNEKRGINDFMLERGLIAAGEADGQSIETLMKANRGEFKERPQVGGEVFRMINGSPSPMWCINTRKQIESVGIAVSDVSMTNNEITVKQ